MSPKPFLACIAVIAIVRTVAACAEGATVGSDDQNATSAHIGAEDCDTQTDVDAGGGHTMHFSDAGGGHHEGGSPNSGNDAGWSGTPCYGGDGGSSYGGDGGSSYGGDGGSSYGGDGGSPHHEGGLPHYDAGGDPYAYDSGPHHP